MTSPASGVLVISGGWVLVVLLASVTVALLYGELLAREVGRRPCAGCGRRRSPVHGQPWRERRDHARHASGSGRGTRW